MESFLHLFASLDITGIIAASLGAIFSSLVHGFQYTFELVLPGLKKIFEIYPGLVSGSVLILSAYLIYPLVGKMRRATVKVPTAKHRV